MLTVNFNKHLHRLVNCIHDMVRQSYFRARCPFLIACGLPIIVVGICVVLPCLHEPLICQYAMTVIQIELLGHRWTFPVPCCYQNDGAVLKPTLCTHIQELCPVARQVHAQPRQSPWISAKTVTFCATVVLHLYYKVALFGLPCGNPLLGQFSRQQRFLFLTPRQPAKIIFASLHTICGFGNTQNPLKLRKTNKKSWTSF